MTEAEWLACVDPQKMLEILQGKASDRKLRLFAVACCRRVPHLTAEPPLQEAIRVSERYAEGLCSLEEVLAVVPAALDLPHPRSEYTATPAGYVHWHWQEDGGADFNSSDEYYLNLHHYSAVEATLWATGAVRKAGWKDAESAVLQAQRASQAAAAAVEDFSFDPSLPFEIRMKEMDYHWECVRKQKAAHAALLRHFVGSPSRPHSASRSWPSNVIQLADALYNGRDCGFALHDALLDAGHADLAQHFREERDHPKGCWVVDLVLGKS